MAVVTITVLATGCGVAPGTSRQADAPPSSGPRTPDTPPTALPTPDGLRITSVEPATGRTAGGELVVLLGEGFAQGAEVWFGARPAASVITYGPTVIHVRTPDHQAGVRTWITVGP